MQMQGNTILVAGGARGIGRGLAEQLCWLGNEVIVLDEEPHQAQAAAGATPGMCAVTLDVADPWRVAAFCEQVAGSCPGLNVLVNITIALPVRHLPGLGALLQGDDTHARAQARQLGIQHLTGALLAHFRRRGRGSVMNVSVGPVLGPPPVRRSDFDAGGRACAVSVTKRWARACIEVTDVGVAPSAGAADAALLRPGLSRVQWLSSLAHLLAEGLQEDAAIARLRTLGDVPRPVARETRREALAGVDS
jgi:uncharacterized oxidoreductase